jgi:RNA polymerase sigma factor (sigma-70 family)
VTAGPPKSADDRVGLPESRPSDETLVRLTRAGSNAAFAAIAERYRGPLLGYCGRMLGPDEAEDAVQQTFANALRALRADARAVDLRPWLYRIAHNHSVNSLNRRGRDYEQLDEQYDGVPQPPDILEQKERLTDVVTALDGLPERQRRAILARELEGRSHEEIARSMQATAPVVRQLIHRARTRLRDVCGVLVPASWLRWLMVSDVRAPAAQDRLGDTIAGGSAGAGLLKTGAILLTTGAVATGGAGIVSQEHRFTRDDRDGSAAARVKPAKPSRQAGSNPGQPSRSTSGSVHPKRVVSATTVAAGDGPGRARALRHGGDRDRQSGDHHERERGDQAVPDESDGPSESTHESSLKGGEGDQPDGEEPRLAGDGSEGGDPAEAPAPPESEGESDAGA